MHVFKKKSIFEAAKCNAYESLAHKAYNEHVE